VSVTDEFAAVVAPAAPAVAHSRFEGDPNGTLAERFLEFVTHPNNHKQAFRFLCVGGSGYTVNLITFAICVHLLKINDTASFVVGFLAGTTNNFWWNRSWTFDAAHHHIGKQGVRFLMVSTSVALFAYGIYQLVVSTTGMEKVLAEGIAYIIATPFSFIAQKLWSFKS